MRPFVTISAVLLAVLVAGLIPAQVAATTPDPTSAVMTLRIFNDCPTSVLTTGNAYPATLFIQDDVLACGGFANRHNWRFSVDGATPVDFDNGSAFQYSATLVISGTSDGEAGLNVSPWWSQDVDGVFNVRSTDGEIACFGGRLPFYSFTLDQGVVYVKGTPIRMQITYLPGALRNDNPATIEYELDYNMVHYTSGPLPFDNGNPLEEPPHGLWGMLNEARVGGHIQAFLQAGNVNAGLRADWRDIIFTNLDSPIPVEPSTWGKIKALY